jgi:drug/metabolite transporter (DMT)-like permease
MTWTVKKGGNMSEKAIAFGNLTLAMIIVGSSVVFGKVIIQSFPVFLASGLRFAVATAIILPLVVNSEGGFPRVPRRDWLILIIMALCGQILFTVLLLFGLKMTSAMEAGIITSTTPAAMGMVAFLVLRERLGLHQWLGIVLAVMGVLAVNGFLTPQIMTAGRRAHLMGNLLVCIAVFGEAVFLLLRKTIDHKASSMATTAILCLLGLIMFLPLSLYQALNFDFASVGYLGWGAILYFGAIFTVMAYILWFNGVTKVSGGTAGVFTAVMPISAVTFAALFLDEAFSLSTLLGVAFVLAAILMLSWKSDKEPNPIPGSRGSN